MKREHKLLKNTLVLAFGTLLPKLATIITLPILTGFLSKEEYGTLDLVIVLVSFVLPVATLQIQTAAFRFLIDARQDRSEIKSIITNLYAFIIPMSIVTLVVLFFLLPTVTKEIRVLICLYMFADILLNAACQCLRGLGKNKVYSINAIIGAICNAVLIILMVSVYKKGLTGALIAMLAACVLSNVLLSLSAKLYSYIDLRMISRGKIKELIQYSWAMVPNSMSMSVMRVSDRFVVTSVLGVAVNAVYSAANKIPNILTNVQRVFTMAWQENASIVSKDEDAGQYYSYMFRAIFDLMAGSLGLLICATPWLFPLLIRGDYAEAYNHMPILFLAMFFYSLCSYLGGIYVAYKDIKSVGITTMIAAVVNLVVDIALINWIGLYAASCSTLISYLLLFVFRVFDIRKTVKIEYSCFHILAVIGILVLESLFCFIRRPFFDILNFVLGVFAFLVLNRSLIKSVCNTIRKRLVRR